MNAILSFLVRIFLLGSAATGMASGGEVRIQLPQGGGTLVLNVPNSWKHQVSVPEANQPLTITLTPKDGPRFEVLLTPIWRPGLTK